MPGLKLNPNALPAMLDQGVCEIFVNGAIVVLQIDPRVNGVDWILLQIFQALTTMEQRATAIETVIVGLPGCGRPIEGLPALMIANDAMRDALGAIHDLVDARAVAVAANESADPSAD